MPYRDATEALRQERDQLAQDLESVRAKRRALTALAAEEAALAKNLASADKKLREASAHGAKTPSMLDQVRIASPCTANWDDMVGDERMRFCGSCAKNVYNIAGMTRDEAEKLLAGSDGKLCVRLFRRADGTILTSDCPVGEQKKRRRLALVSTLGGSLAVVAIAAAESSSRTMGAVRVAPMGPPGVQVMGDVERPAAPQPLDTAEPGPVESAPDPKAPTPPKPSSPPRRLPPRAGGGAPQP
jgi:hypothetical protein